MDLSLPRYAHEYALLLPAALPVLAIIVINVLLWLAGERGTLLLPSVTPLRHSDPPKVAARSAAELADALSLAATLATQRSREGATRSAEEERRVGSGDRRRETAGRDRRVASENADRRMAIA